MTRITRLVLRSGVATLLGALGLLPSLSAVAASDPVMEEIIVTGSLIRRDSFDSASPLTVIDQDQIANNATPNLGEVLVNQTFNYGSDFQTNTYAARTQIGTATAANLRGLGTNATLNLLDGKRGAGGNLNNALPQIAIQRIDILKDGASALYGTDAVAGVVNLIPRKDFSGAKVSAFYTEDPDDDFHDQLYEFMIGSDVGDGHFMLAGSYSRRTTLEQTERPRYLRNGFSRSTTGNPGTWQVPNRLANGEIDPNNPTSVQRDPGCGVATDIGPGGRDVGTKGNFLSGHTDNLFAQRFATKLLPQPTLDFFAQFGITPDENGSLPAGVIPLSNSTTGDPECALEFGENWNFINPQEKYSAYMNFQHQFTNNLSNEIDIVASRLITDSRGSPQNPGGRTEEFPIVRGEHPGNPFRALNADGAPLFAQDADSDGLPDRDPNTDANNDGVADVILAVDPLDPNAGIPFNEDVDVVALRAMGKIGLMPGANQPTGLNADGSNTGNATFDAYNYRIRDTLRWEIPDSTWSVEATAIFAQGQVVLEEKNTSQNALEAGLKGELVAVPESDPRNVGPEFWNPFSTQALNCTNRQCEHTGNPDFVNSVRVLDAINIQSNQVTNTEFTSAELIATGDLMDLPAGMMQAAFGTEWRKNYEEVDISAARNQCDWHEGGCAFDWKAKQDVWSGFFELAIPAHDTLDVTLAGRYSDYGGDIGDSFDPKFSALWQPMDIVSVRASWSSAFIAPTLVQQFSSEICALETMQDTLTGDTSGTFRVACVSGNPNLVPEEADTFNIGVSLNLLDGDLTLGIDYANYDFQDRISQETGNNVLRASLARFQAAGGDVNGPDNDGNGLADDVDEWINPANNNEPKIFRDSTGVVTRVIAERLNAQEMEHTAWDFYGRYNLSLANIGDFTLGVNATYVDEFTFDLGTGDPDDQGDGAGKQNEQVAEIPPLPEWRINGTLDWFRGNHSARIRVRWIDSFELEFNSGALQGLQQAAFGTLEADDITYIDVKYEYTFDQLLGDRATTFEIGANNVTDEFPDSFLNLGGIETFVHDIRGRMWYVRVNQDI